MRWLEYYLLLLGLISGLRFEALVGLIFSDYNFDNKEITVDKTWGYNNRMPIGFGPLKNKTSKRKVKLENITNENNLVFYNEKSKYKVIANERANDILREVLLELNIHSLITMYGLRHTHSNILVYSLLYI